MSVGAQQTYVQLWNRGRTYTFLLDSGASISLIKNSVIENKKLIRSNDNMKIVGISGNSLYTLGSVSIKFQSKKFRGSINFQVLPDSKSLRVDGILGADFFSQFFVDLCFSNNTIYIKKCNSKLPILRENTVLSQHLPSHSLCYVEVLNIQNDTVIINSQKIKKDIHLIGCLQTTHHNKLTLTFENNTSHAFLLKNFIPHIQQFDESYYDVKYFTTHKVAEQSISNDNTIFTINNESTEKLKLRLLEDYKDLIATDDKSVANLPGQQIYLKPFTAPRYIRQYRLPPNYRRVISEKVKEMVDQGLAEPSYSPWNAPVLLVPKKGAKTVDNYRLVIDYRQLNNVVEDDKYPIPDMGEILDGLGKAQIFSTLDLDQGYYQIPLHKESRPYTAFSTPDGHFNLTRLPMGLKVSPAIFSRLMRHVLGDLVGKICYVYLDDVIVYGLNEENHARNLKKIFQRFREVGLKINFKKCNFFQDSVSFLGHIVSKDGLRPDPAKFEVIKNWPTPKTVKEVQSFLGLVNYYRRFVKHFAAIAKPLYNLTKTDKTFEWTHECEQAFSSLKLKVMNPPVLAFPDFSKPFYIQTDASITGVGAVLMNHDRRPVAFLSRSLNKAELSYGITDLEALAIVWALKKWSNYLLGHKFIVETDHKALEQLFKMRDPSSRLIRFRLCLEQFDFEVHYLKGKNNVVADALSRVSVSIKDLIAMRVDIVTRLQKKRLQEALAKPTDTSIIPDEPIITSLLRKQCDLPLIKFCDNITSLSSFKNGEQVLVDNDYLVGYFPLLGELYLNKPTSLPGVEPQHALNNLKIALWRVVRRVNKYKFNIISPEKDLGQEYREILGYLGRNENRNLGSLGQNEQNDKEKKNDLHEKASIEKLQFCIIPEVTYVTDKNKQEEIIKNLHCLPTGGHFGVEKMFKTLKLTYYWPNMVDQIKIFVKNCEMCQVKKHSKHIKSPMTITSTSNVTFERTYVDLVGPLPVSNAGNVYILTIQDDLSKFLWCYPLPNKTSEEVARALVTKLFLPYHFPKFIISDKGLEFFGIHREVCKLLGIDHITSTLYHHQTIGALENSHKSLNAYLRMYAKEDIGNWDEWLPYFSYAYNSTVHLSTNYAPFELIFGSNNKLSNETEASLSGPCYNYDDYVSELRYRLKIALQEARKIQLNNKGKRKEKYDKNFNAKFLTYNVGDYVVVKSESSSKLDNIYKGPYKIVRIDKQNIFIEIKNQIQKVHIDNIKRYYSTLSFWIDFS